MAEDDYTDDAFEEPSEDASLEDELAEAEAEETSTEPPKAKQPAPAVRPAAAPAAKPAAAPASPWAGDPIYRTLPQHYQAAVDRGAYTPAQALQTWTANNRQQVGRLSRTIQELRDAQTQRDARLEDRLERLAKKLDGSPDEPEAEPGDPRLARVEEMTGKALAALEDREDRDGAERDADAVESYIAQDLEAVMAEDPTYEHAEGFVMDRLLTESVDRYLSQGATPAEADRLARQAVLDFAARAQVTHHAQGTSLARAVLVLAKQWGFNGAAAPAAPSRPAAPLRRDAPRKPGGTVGKMRERLAGTMPAGAGARAVPKVTPVRDLEAALGTMTDEEFDDFLGGVGTKESERDKVFSRVAAQLARPG